MEMNRSPLLRAYPKAHVAPASSRYACQVMGWAPSRRIMRQSWCRYPVPMLLLAVLFVTSGMTGGNCASAVPDPANGPATNDANLAFRRPVLLPEDHVLGDASAPLVVVEYEDYQAPVCGRFARLDFPILRAEYIDTGRIRWVFRHFPQADNDRATPAARAAECAHDQGFFLEYRDLIYATTDADNATILTDAMLKQHADTLGLDRTLFDACLGGDFKNARVDQDVNSATALGAETAPAFVIGSELVSTLDTADQLRVIIDRHLRDVE